ncbi:hypothetical protein ACQEVS_11900 [Streptomyces sp. CA-181903]|uniref:hypothetical protein n=1 Tax=Streptomyces sp. CA-181903 TaxID=3240055 RepID=UPI003D94CD49
MLTRPAPSLFRAEAAVPERELRTDTGREGVLPSPRVERDRRPDTERREGAEREDRVERVEEGGWVEPVGPVELVDLSEDRPPVPPATMPVAGEESVPVGETTGARPQVSQYVSPPPTSS